MTKRRTLVIAVAGLAAVACAAFAVAYIYRDPVNPSACERIQKGMTDAEVTQILGRPCDNEGHSFPAWRGTRETYKIWRGPSGCLGVTLGESSLVQNVEFQKDEDSVWRKLRRKLGLEVAPTPVPTPAYPLQIEQNWQEAER